MGQILTDQQIQELASDKGFTPEDHALLTPGERTRLAAVKAQNTTVGRVKGFGTGLVKGASETAINLGKVVHNTPVLGNLTDALAKLVGPEGTDPKAAFAQDAGKMQMTVPGLGDVDTEAKSGMETAGKTVEGIGEMFIPASPSRLAAVRQLVKLIPNSSSASTVKMLNRAAALAGRTVGEGGSAAAVSTLHGEGNPEVEGTVAAASPLAGEALAKMVALLRTPFGQKVAPVLAAAGVMPMLGGITPTGIGGMMGTYGLVKGAAHQAATAPGFVPKAQNAVRKGATVGGRTAAGVTDQVRLQRRRLQE